MFGTFFRNMFGMFLAHYWVIFGAFLGVYLVCVVLRFTFSYYGVFRTSLSCLIIFLIKICSLLNRPLPYERLSKPLCLGNINLSTTQTRLYPCLGLLGNLITKKHTQAGPKKYTKFANELNNNKTGGGAKGRPLLYGCSIHL